MAALLMSSSLQAQNHLISEALRSSKEVTLNQWRSRTAPSNGLDYLAELGSQPYPVAPKKDYQEKFDALRATWGEARGYDLVAGKVPLDLTLIAPSVSVERPGASYVTAANLLYTTPRDVKPDGLDNTPKELYAVLKVVAQTCFGEDENFARSLEERARATMVFSHDTGHGLLKRPINGKNTIAVIDARAGQYGYLNVLFMRQGRGVSTEGKVYCDFNKEPLVSSE